MALPALPCILTIAGSDPSGGAGIQADLKTFTVLGAVGMSAITALTVQNTRGVQDLEPIDAEFVVRQIQTLADDISIHAVKTGMLVNKAIVEAVAVTIKTTELQHLVVDPVLMSKNGHPLLTEDACKAMEQQLFPLAEIITPNLPEAAHFCGFPIKSDQDLRQACQRLYDMGPKAVLIKGGHGEDKEATDILFNGNDYYSYSAARIETPHTHGTGCTYSAAIATLLAKGLPLPEAVKRGKEFITEAIRFSLPMGKGQGPTNPYAAARELCKKDHDHD